MKNWFTFIAILTLFSVGCTCPSGSYNEVVKFDKDLKLKKLYNRSLCVIKAINLTGASAEKNFDSINRMELKFHLKDKKSCNSLYLPDFKGEVYIYNHNLLHFLKYENISFDSDFRKCEDKSFLFSNFPSHKPEEMILFYVPHKGDIIIVHCSIDEIKEIN